MLNLPAIKEHFGPLGQLTRQLLPGVDPSRAFVTFVSSVNVVCEGPAKERKRESECEECVNERKSSEKSLTTSAATTNASTSVMTASTATALFTFALPNSTTAHPSTSHPNATLIPSLSGILVKQEYFLVVKAVLADGRQSIHPIPVKVLPGNLEYLRACQLSAAAKFVSQLRRSNAEDVEPEEEEERQVMAVLTVQPTVCMAGGHVAVQLSEINVSSQLQVLLQLECVEEYLAPAAATASNQPQQLLRLSETVRQYSGSPGFLDAWEQLVPLAPDWQPSVEVDGIVRVSWRLRMTFSLEEEGEFEVAIPLQLYSNKHLLS